MLPTKNYKHTFLFLLKLFTETLLAFSPRIL